MDILDRINKLKKEKNAVVLAHYYQPMEIQKVADIVGDSLELARKSKDTDADILVFCGVSFMGESAALLCPDKRVLVPAPDAGCYMADTVTPDDVLALKAANPKATVVCYINSTARVKAVSDVCCTSSNAVKVVKSVEAEEIIFVPDKNLGKYIADQMPEKRFIFHEGGCCKIHDRLRAEKVLAEKAAHPHAGVLVHPECNGEVCAMADFIGSTAQIIDYCKNSEKDEFIICTELGVTERMRALMPSKRFYVPDTEQLYCDMMKKISLQTLLDCLEKETGEVFVDDELRAEALKPIERMLSI